MAEAEYSYKLLCCYKITITDNDALKNTAMSELTSSGYSSEEATAMIHDGTDFNPSKAVKCLSELISWNGCTITTADVEWEV